MKHKTKFKNFGNIGYRLPVREWPIYRYRPQKVIPVDLYYTSLLSKNANISVYFFTYELFPFSCELIQL